MRSYPNNAPRSSCILFAIASPKLTRVDIDQLLASSLSVLRNRPSRSSSSFGGQHWPSRAHSNHSLLSPRTAQAARNGNFKTRRPEGAHLIAVAISFVRIRAPVPIAVRWRASAPPGSFTGLPRDPQLRSPISALHMATNAEPDPWSHGMMSVDLCTPILPGSAVPASYECLPFAIVRTSFSSPSRPMHPSAWAMRPAPLTNARDWHGDRSGF